MIHLETRLRMDWSDLDTYGHINNISILRYFQSARVHFWESNGWVDFFEQHTVGHILVSTKCDFKKELQYPGEVFIKTSVAFTKNTSFGLHHELYNTDKELCAENQDVAVCYNFSEKRSVSIPSSLRELMKPYQRTDEQDF